MFRRMQAGFVPAAQRERCGTCNQVQTHKPSADVTELSCSKVGFVTSWAVCKGWESASQALKPVPNRSKTESQAHGAETGSSVPVADSQKEAS